MATSDAKQIKLWLESETPALVAYRQRRAAAGLAPTPIEAAVNAATGTVTAPPSTPIPGVTQVDYTASLMPVTPSLGSGLNDIAGLLGGGGALALGGDLFGGLLGGLSGLFPDLAGVAGIAGGVYGILQALGLGEGGGLFGNNLLGGDTTYVDGIPLGGPGLAEPPAAYVQKEWHVKYDWGTLQYYLVKMPGQSRKIALYNTATKRWKVWTWRKPSLAVIGKNMPSHKMIVRLRRNLGKQASDARTILKLTSPKSLRTARRRRR